ncbi:MAG: hypothetical protein P5700_27000, partial [Arthrospira platensis PCC 7345]|nr:hypothetical protein [Arthrospira platensis PCC 7345]
LPLHKDLDISAIAPVPPLVCLWDYRHSVDSYLTGSFCSLIKLMLGSTYKIDVGFHHGDRNTP